MSSSRACETATVRGAKPPGLPHGKVRTAAQLLRNPDMLAHLSVFDEQRTDFVHWRVGFQRFFASRWSFAAPLSPDTRWFVFVVAPAAATYFMYHIVLEITLRGRTPGKRMAGIQILTRDGSSPSRRVNSSYDRGCGTRCTSRR